MICKDCEGFMRTPTGKSRETGLCGRCRGIKTCPKLQKPIRKFKKSA